jgi:hypothetical protein
VARLSEQAIERVYECEHYRDIATPVGLPGMLNYDFSDT